MSDSSMDASLWSALARGLFPVRCFACRAWLGGVEGLPLCGDCRDELRGATETCPRCALPTVDGRLCGQCITRPPPWQSARACWLYRGLAAELIQAYKFRHALYLERGLSAALAGMSDRIAGDRVLPVPLHPQRRVARGFNQCEAPAAALAQALEVPLSLNAVRRCRNTPHLAYGAGRRERRRQVRGSFEVRESVRGERLILVDDVMTTGATLEALTRCLLSAGARSVSLALLARTP